MGAASDYLRKWGVCFAVWLMLVGGAVFAQGPLTLNPAQAAYLTAENRRIEDRFVAQVAAIAKTSPERVRAAMPDERRITTTVSRLVMALEQDLGRPLDASQRAAIIDADEARKNARVAAREGAARR